MDTLLQDLRYALRTLRKSPGFTVVAVLTLALGIGATTAMFSVTNGVLLQPLPIHEQDRLVLLYKEAPRDNSLRPFGVADLAALRERSGVFESVAGVQYDGAFPYVTQDGDRTLSLMASLVSGEFFRVLDVHPTTGRLLEPADAVAGAEPVVMISYGAWQGVFGGDPRAVGRMIRLGQRARTIVGVAPRGFVFPKGVEVWVPLQLTPDVVNDRQFEPFSIIGRLRTGATIDQAQGEATAFVHERETVSLPGETLGQRAIVDPFRDAVIGNLRQSVLILSAAVVLVLVVAGINVANLLMIRGVTREPELAVRTALGAGPGRITRQLLVESGVLAAAGGLLGVVLAYWVVRWLVAVAPPELPRLSEVRLDGWVLNFAVAVSLASTLLFGLVPAWWTSRAQLITTLRSGARGGDENRRAQFVKQALVVCQVALAIIVVAGAGLLAKSLARLQHVDMGFDASRLTLVKVAVSREVTASRYLTFFDQLTARLDATPGITATPIVLAPFSGAGGWDASFTAEGQGHAAASENPTLNLEPVAPNYFETMGIPLYQGRSFTEQDRVGSPPVAIVSRATAGRTWPGQDPLGKRLRFGPPSSREPWLTVVGVVGDTRYRELTSARPSIYIPFRQATASPGLLPSYMAVRSTATANVVIGAARSAAHELDPAVPVLDADPLPRLFAGQIARPRFDTLLLTAFSVIALVLAAVGLYGTMALFVGQRTHEIGVRVALGARPVDVRRLVLGQGLLLAVVGIALGVIGALATTHLLAGILYEVSPTDPSTLLGVAILLLITAVLACLVPVRRATRVDPMVALRAE